MIVRNGLRPFSKGLVSCYLAALSQPLKQLGKTDSLGFASATEDWQQGQGPPPFNSRGEHSQEASRPNELQKRVLYKGRWIVPFRVLVRLKIFQLAGVAALAVPLGTFLTEGGVSFTSLAVSSALLVGCGVSASTLNYYSSRYVGELVLIQQPAGEPILCFSVLDFWGNREDNFVRLSNVVPPLKGLTLAGLHEMALQPLVPVKVDGDRQFYISLRHGIMIDKDTLLQILKGQYE